MKAIVTGITLAFKQNWLWQRKVNQPVLYISFNDNRQCVKGSCSVSLFCDKYILSQKEKERTSSVITPKMGQSLIIKDELFVAEASTLCWLVFLSSHPFVQVFITNLLFSLEAELTTTALLLQTFL